MWIAKQKMVLSALFALIILVAFIYFKPHIMIFGPKEIKHPTYELMSNDHSDVNLKLNAVNESGHFISVVLQTEEAEAAEQKKSTESNRAIDFLKFTTKTVSQGLEQRHSNEMTGSDIVKLYPEHAAVSFGNALNKLSDDKSKSEAESIKGLLDSVIGNVDSIMDSTTLGNSEAVNQKHQNDYDNLYR